jgi:hypothetical protein
VLGERDRESDRAGLDAAIAWAASIVGSSASVNAAPVAADRASEVVTEEDRTLCKLISEVFDVEQVAPDDDFFALGGHALLAMILRNRIRVRLRVDVPLRAVSDARTVQHLSTRLHQ